MRVLHLFDRYLNGTMNWAYNLLEQTQNTDHIIAAPLFISNRFLEAPFTFWDSPFQRGHAPNEWEISRSQLLLSKLGTATSIYNRYLIRKIRKEPLDLIHAHFAGVGWKGLGIARATGIPYVVSFYGYDYEQLPFRNPVFKERYKELFEEATSILVEGPHGRRS